MGADLIGYIVVGPKELDKSEEKKKALMAAAEKNKKLIDEISALLEEKNLSDEDYETQLAAVSDAQRKFLEDLAAARERDGWFEADSVEDLLDFAEETCTPEAVETSISRLFDLWDGGARDAMSRSMPGNPEKRIMACGELSWGDEPGGYGYQTLKLASSTGILDAYGIE